MVVGGDDGPDALPLVWVVARVVGRGDNTWQ